MHLSYASCAYARQTDFYGLFQNPLIVYAVPLCISNSLLTFSRLPLRRHSVCDAMNINGAIARCVCLYRE